MKVVLIILLLVFNIPVYKRLFNLFFYDLFDFKECLRHLATPDFMSLFVGEYWKDKWNEFKVMFYFFCCVMIVGIEYLIIYLSYVNLR